MVWAAVPERAAAFGMPKNCILPCHLTVEDQDRNFLFLASSVIGK